MKNDKFKFLFFLIWYIVVMFIRHIWVIFQSIDNIIDYDIEQFSSAVLGSLRKLRINFTST